MAAEPMTLSDSRSMRAGTGIGIALAVAATVGAIAFLAPRLREEMAGDVLAGVGARAPASKPVVAPPPKPVPASGLAPATTIPAPAAPAAPEPATPVALKPATQIVPTGSLAPGESEVAAAPAAHATGKPTHRAHPAPRKKSIEPQRSARVPAPRLVVDDSVGGRPLRPAPPAPRERIAPRREASGQSRLVGGIHREDPLDYRTWRPHRNPDAPSSSPIDRQPG